MRKTTLLIVLAIIIGCGEGMVDKGMNAALDPLRPEINVKQEAINLPSGDDKSAKIIGVSPGSSAEVTFTIENLGTADLILLGNPIISISSDILYEFPQDELTQPQSSIIPAGRSTTFTVKFSPVSIGTKTATVTILNNDFDESSYEFIITGTTIPAAGFSAKVRKGITSLTVDFVDESIGDITDWAWDFNSDGTIDSTEQNPTYMYNMPGTYSVVLTVTGPGGFNYKIKNNYVTVSMPVETTIDVTSTGLENIKSVCADDITSDNNMDVIAADDTGIFSWYNSGGGSFGTIQTVDNTFTPAIAICTADIDGVNGVDIIAAREKGIAWWSNNGDGTFGAANNIINDTGVYEDTVDNVYVADINGDGDIDIITLAQVSTVITDSGLRVWLNDGAGGFSSILVHDWAFDAAVIADIDNDGDLDIVASWNSNPGNLMWYENTTGDGTAWASHTIDDTTTGIKSLASIDIDNDGDLDIVGMCYTDYPEDTILEIAWWENTDGKGTFAARATFDDTYITPRSIFAADINKDLRTDILAAGDSIVTLWKHNTSDYSKYILNYKLTGACSVSAADMDNDGDTDVLAAGTNSISWYNISLDGWYKNTIDDAFDGANSVSAADLNNDDNIDIIATAKNTDNTTGIIAWWKNTGNGNFAADNIPIELTLPGVSSFIANDIDNDQYVDIISAGYSHPVYWWDNIDGNGIYWNKILLCDSTASGGLHIFAADIDRDNDLDIIEASYGSGTLNWWENINGSWTLHSISSGGSRNYVVAADLTGDIFPDVIVADNAGIYWWQNSGISADYFPNGNTAYPTGCKHTLTNTFTPAYSVYAVDIDKDGDNDILGAAGGSVDEIALWKNNGSGTFSTKITIGSSFNGACSVYASDIDGDGDIDVIGAAKDADKICWWENLDGLGTSWKEHIISTGFDGASSVFAIDIDNDDDIDIIATAELSGEVAVFENNLN